MNSFKSLKRYRLQAVALFLSGLALPFAFAAENSAPVVQVNEVFFTSRHHAENVDSTATWIGGDGQRWLLSSAKSTHSILVEDATNGAFIRRIGGLGSRLGQFNRPNGVWVVDDLLFVVERDNRRVQVLALPEFYAIGSFGVETLVNPYGLYVGANGDDQFTVYVTDNYETADETIPADSELGKRVAIFEVEVEGVSDGTMDFDLVGFMGETSGKGALRVVESIYGDPENNVLMIAEEDNEHPTSGFKVYDFEGRFSGRILGEGAILGQSEGIALVPGAGKSGYWICTDQGKRRNLFHVFDRESFDYLGAFEGRYTLNTDGVWFCPEPLPRFPQGAFFAVHNDGNVAAFDWAEIKEALDLK